MEAVVSTQSTGFDTLKKFIDCNSGNYFGEIIILDFHRFSCMERKHFPDLVAQVESGLEGYTIPHGVFTTNSTLNQIWQNTTSKQRLLLTWFGEGGNTNMWPGVNHHWYDARSCKEVLKGISDSTGCPPCDLKFWSICWFMTPPVGVKTLFMLAEEIERESELEGWLYQVDRLINTNILMVDHFHHLHSVLKLAIVSNLIKSF
eukprot:TRINITY_DN11405_c0_g3_i2.p1 TRINITY_DN11405_c0_g3~~TRINITY_DN11405_c0_g3_i2.p1  ORF type:complete len:203 (+),score=42.35 TRINITY_DN11405_c0_g3_i2:34-642(+)